MGGLCTCCWSQIRARGRMLFAALTRAAPGRAKLLLAGMDSGAQKQLTQPLALDAPGTCSSNGSTHSVFTCTAVLCGQREVDSLCVGGRARQSQSRAASAAVFSQKTKQPGSSGGIVRLVASASSTRQNGRYPLIPLKEPQADALRPRPATAYRPAAGPADLGIGVSLQAELDSTIARQPSARPNSRRSIGGAALRVSRPEPPAASARPPVAVGQLALPDDQAASSRLPPRARRTSSFSMLPGRGPSANGAARDQADQPAARRPSALGGSIRERALLETASIA